MTKGRLHRHVLSTRSQAVEFTTTPVGMFFAFASTMGASEHGGSQDKRDLQTKDFAGAPPQDTSEERSTVLIVDDDEDVRFLSSNLLRAIGYNTIEGCDGADALVSLRAAVRPPAAIITDLSMPRLDGWQFIEELRGDGRWSAIPIIVISASASPPPGVPCLCKPVRRQLLLDALAGVGAASPAMLH